MTGDQIDQIETLSAFLPRDNESRDVTDVYMRRVEEEPHLFERVNLSGRVVSGEFLEGRKFKFTKK